LQTEIQHKPLSQIKNTLTYPNQPTEQFGSSNTEQKIPAIDQRSPWN